MYNPLPLQRIWCSTQFSKCYGFNAIVGSGDQGESGEYTMFVRCNETVRGSRERACNAQHSLYCGWRSKKCIKVAVNGSTRAVRLVTKSEQ